MDSLTLSFPPSLQIPSGRWLRDVSPVQRMSGQGERASSSFRQTAPLRLQATRGEDRLAQAGTYSDLS